MEVSLRRKCGGLLGPVEPDGASLGPLEVATPQPIDLIADHNFHHSSSTTPPISTTTTPSILHQNTPNSR